MQGRGGRTLAPIECLKQTMGATIMRVSGGASCRW